MTQATLRLLIHTPLTAILGRPTSGDWEYILLQGDRIV